MICQPDLNHSKTYLIIAALLAKLEQFDLSEYCLLDSGTILKISPRLYEQIEHTQEFQDFLGIHGSWMFSISRDWYSPENMPSDLPNEDEIEINFDGWYVA